MSFNYEAAYKKVTERLKWILQDMAVVYPQYSPDQIVDMIRRAIHDAEKAGAFPLRPGDRATVKGHSLPVFCIVVARFGRVFVMYDVKDSMPKIVDLDDIVEPIRLSEYERAQNLKWLEKRVNG